MGRAKGVEGRSGPALPLESEEAGGGSLVHLAELPVGRGQNMAVGVGSPHALRRPQASPGPLFSPQPQLTSTPISAPGSWHTGRGIKPTWGQPCWGLPTPRSSAAFLPCLFSHIWEGRGSWGRQALRPGASPPASCLPLGTILQGHTGPGLVSREVLLSQECGRGRSWDPSPSLWYTPGPGQHVDVSAELSCILGQLLWCGVVPWVHWLQRGPRGTQR